MFQYHIGLRKRARAAFARLCPIPLLMASLAVASHADEGRGVNGGRLADTGTGHVEFIGGAGYELLMFAVSDLDKRPVAVAGGAAFVVVHANGKKYRIALRPDGDNLLSVRLKSPLSRGQSLEFVADLASGERLTANFPAP